MSLFTKLRRLFRFKRHSTCSPIGLRWERLSPRARGAAKRLTYDELLTISKFNPFKAERNAALRKWKRKGMSQAVLSELSGLSRRHVEVITSFRNLEKETDDGNLHK
jgi:hypothetical protein